MRERRAPTETDPEQVRTQVAAHLLYLGYTVDAPDEEGWSYARHPIRYNFHFRPLRWGIRLHCTVSLDAAKGNTRERWLRFLNNANERSGFTQFWICANAWGEDTIRMSALVMGSYDRQVFAMAMDLWHEDLDIVRRKPDFPEEDAVVEREAAAAIVN